ncbi:MAG: NAD(P)H-dependent oxidoreductase [Sphingorhabdus sp.]|uniref:NAD(P)H-dependent oxidoreductase n=1 Tax=Sphingorhabdus sp. TaxID=1902408 RepID=UPI0025FAFF80|nr:NAD(P)H-dependent oxidoreductase [Sphingorhabdus sp.]MCO4091744.1 NAD(P)H-dependent oxidoreductase [Sphingorhabdus sp.]
MTGYDAIRNAVRKIAIFDAHPDPEPARYVHALADSYGAGARGAGHEVRQIMLGGINIPILHSREDWMQNDAPAEVKSGQDAILWADHIVFVYPLWLGDMPALLKAFLEQVLRPGTALQYGDSAAPEKLMKGKSARLVVTMGMPAIFYRAYYGARSVRSFKRNILELVGIDPVETSLIGNVEGSAKHRERWLERMTEYGAAGN